jgi:hypothetical protein
VTLEPLGIKEGIKVILQAAEHHVLQTQALGHICHHLSLRKKVDTLFRPLSLHID